MGKPTDKISADTSRSYTPELMPMMHAITRPSLQYKQVSKVNWQKSASPTCHPHGYKWIHPILTRI